MNRPIKFRAWDTKSKQMFTGVSLLSAWNHDGKHFDSEYRDTILMQFTGLLDKHGKEIYEGDIIGIDNITLGQIVRMASNDDFPTAGFTIHYLTPQHPAPISVSKHYEVIGNIFDSPSLLTPNTNSK